MRAVCIKLGLAVLIALLSPTTYAQNAASPVVVAATETGGAQVIGSDAEERTLVRIKDEFDRLRILLIVVLFASAAIGLGVYYYMHGAWMARDALVGFLIALILPAISVWMLEMTAITAASPCLIDQQGALSAEVEDMCRVGREHAANALGLRSLWSMISSQKAVGGVLVPIGVVNIRFLFYLSAVLGSCALYLLLKPLVRRLINR